MGPSKIRKQTVCNGKLETNTELEKALVAISFLMEEVILLFI